MRTKDSIFPRFSEAEYERRYGKVGALMEGQGAGALVVYGDSQTNRVAQADLHYLSNFQGNRRNYLVLPASGEPALFVQSFNHVPDAQRMSILPDTRWGGVSSAETVAGHLRQLGVGSGQVGLVGAIPFDDYLLLTERLPGVRFLNITRAFRRLRCDKSDEEIEWIRKAAAFTDATVRALEAELRPGLREDQLGAIVEGAYVPDGGQHHIHYISSTSMHDSQRCVPAQSPTDRVLQKGDVVLTEISVQWWTYSGQILRPFAVGQDPTPDYADLYRVAEEAYHRVAEAIRPGATSHDVLEAARAIDESGYTICDGLVHGFAPGLLPPSIRTPKTQEGPTQEWTFQPNQCVVIQPNVITPDYRKGVQVGNLCLVTESGLEPLQAYPIRFVRVG